MRRHLDFAKPTLWICPKCGTGVKTSENQPRCRVYGFREGPS